MYVLYRAVIIIITWFDYVLLSMVNITTTTTTTTTTIIIITPSPKDVYLRSQMDGETGYVPLQLISEFPKVGM